MPDTGSPLFHASFAFAVASVAALICGESGPTAFVPALISMLLDLDASISSSSRFEHALHSRYALLGALALPFFASVLSMDVFIAALPAVALMSHLFQDVISGEAGVGDGPFTARLYLPRTGRAIDMASLLAALVFMLV